MKIAVIGCGRWGSFHAWYASKIGHSVILYGRENSKNMKQLETFGGNDYLELPEEVKLTKNLFEAVNFAKVIIISVSSQGLRELLQEMKSLENIDLSEKKFVLCMKGLESGTGKRLSVVFNEELNLNAAVWVGPGHVQDFTKKIPNCMVMSSADENFSREVVEIFKSPLIRFYYGNDLIGTEIGAAAKNVIGIAAGMLDGLNCSSLKGALMARGTAELSRLVEALGGEKMTIYGLSHLGDYEATLFSPHSRNRKFGESFVTQKNFDKLAEGVDTVAALMKLAEVTKVELPICRAVYRIIFEKHDPEEQLMELFLRSTKSE
ncbi:MAG: NAD(P)H-dependent glycerol-3-phosphate dehydrogenase [Selenomonadaceae bacterium]|nr:NAD(P)H-dependent glycerol-3-phosphate dehydrogenase [Selenomonadaceae bacterium]